MVRAPEYYENFRCTASECSDNCCRAGWLIELDRDTSEYYMRLEGNVGERLRASLISDEEGGVCFLLNNGSCPHLDENGLCRICSELGSEHMGIVCREFPRYSITIGNITEKGIGLACGEAAMLVLFDGRAFRLVKIEEDTSDTTASGAECVNGKDTQSADRLFRARDDIFRLLSGADGCASSVWQRIVSVLEYASVLQNTLNGQADAETAVRHGLPEDFSVKYNYSLLLDIFNGGDIINDAWRVEAKRVRTFIEGLDDNAFKKALSECGEHIAGGEAVFERLMRYFVYRYFMRAAYDYNPLDKIKFAVCCCLMIRQMLAARQAQRHMPAAGRAQRQPEGQADITREELIDVVKLFSRQVEYSEDNVDAVCEEFLFGDDFDTCRLAQMMSFI